MFGTGELTSVVTVAVNVIATPKAAPLGCELVTVVFVGAALTVTLMGPALTGEKAGWPLLLIPL